MRTARVRTSGEYLAEVFIIAPPSQGLEPPVNPERFITDDALVRRLQQPPESGLGISGGQWPGAEMGVCGALRGARQLGEKGAAPRYQGQKIVFGTAR